MGRKEVTLTEEIKVICSRHPSHAYLMSDGKTLLTIAETAELLNCSSGFVRKRIALSESNQPGGWPKTVYLNLQPNGAKSLYRVDKAALQEYLKTSSNAKVETEAACAVCPV